MPPAKCTRARPLRWPRTSCLRLCVAASSQNQSMSHLGWCVTRMTWSSGDMRSSAILAKYLQSQRHSERGLDDSL